MTTLQEAAQYRSLYELTGDIKDLNTMLVPRTALAQHREQQPVCHGCGIPAGDVHMSTCKSGKWPSRVSNGDTAAPAPQAQEPTAWRTEALKWIRRKAEDQRATNEQNPRHAEAYPSWGERVRQWHWLADELELEQNSTSFGLEPYQEPAPQPAPKGEPVMFAWKRNDGTYHDASGTEHSCGMQPLFAHAEPKPQPAQGVEACMINLPEPAAWLANYGGNVYTEAQLKQAVHDALDKSARVCGAD